MASGAKSVWLIALVVTTQEDKTVAVISIGTATDVADCTFDTLIKVKDKPAIKVFLKFIIFPKYKIGQFIATKLKLYDQTY